MCIYSINERGFKKVKMEKISINSVEDKKTKTGVPFWAVKYNGSENATVWDDQIANHLKKNIGKQVNVEITSKNNFNNIRGCDFTSEGAEDKGKETLLRIPQENAGFNRNNSIVAQCMIKSASEIMSSDNYKTVNSFGQDLHEIMHELIGAYKIALERLNEE